LRFSKISDEEFKESIARSKCVREALLSLGLKAAGGNYATFHQRVKNLGIDTSHFSGAAWAAGKTFGPKRPIDDYLSNSFKISSSSLKKRLIREGIKEAKCECCNLDWWIDKEISLELHHMNGNHFDNSLSNLQLLCPNCHANTENYRGRNQERRLSKEKREVPKFLSEQKEKILEGRRIYQRKTKIVWPSDLDLLDIIWTESVLSFAKTNGISDSSVRKRLSLRNIPAPPPGFFVRRQAGKDVSAEWLVYVGFKKKLISPEGFEPSRL
jgi:hypothetical protein